uniref:4,4'-diaponeurosporenoate glycosyltransferase n=1 Tax=Planktothricoides sp. SpSt-374 TaxID=2282167 RepID=A0A7C3VKT7_9CYAN
MGESTNLISIVVPTLNEAAIIKETISQVKKSGRDTLVEIIVVDGGSRDATMEIASSGGAKVIGSAGGRACQMNAGAKVAAGDVLLFLHADTRLPDRFDVLVRQTLATAGVVAGAFELKIDAPGWGLRLVEKGVNWRSRLLAMPYGDQAIFLPASVFWQLGGFRELPIMEDFELVLRLRRLGLMGIAPAPVVTSARRWQALGVVKTTAINQYMILGYYLGVSKARLAQWYRGKKPEPPDNPSLPL